MKVDTKIWISRKTKHPVLLELAKTICVYLVCALGAWLACLTSESPITVAVIILIASDAIKATRFAFDMKRVTEDELPSNTQDFGKQPHP